MSYFQNENHTIHCGDAIDILNNQIEDSSIDLVFADPPYNIGKSYGGKKGLKVSEDEYVKWTKKWLRLCIDKLKPNGSLYYMTATQFMPHVDIWLASEMDVLSRIVWAYDSSGVQAKKFFGSLYEPVIHAVKNKKDYTFNSQDILVEAKTGAKRKLIDYRKNPPKPYNTKKVPGNVWNIPRVRYKMAEYEDHPTQKPIKLLERIVLASSNPGDTVLDPFSGTFTTSYVAGLNNRKSIGIEMESSYCQIGQNRLKSLPVI